MAGQAAPDRRRGQSGPGSWPGGGAARGTAMTDLLRWGGARLLERGWRQPGTVALGVAAAAGVAGPVYCGAEAFLYQRAAVAEREAAQSEIARLRDELGGTRQALSAARER